MIGSRWYKILNDLWGSKVRTVLIVLSIAVGLFAVGTIVSSQTILSTEMDKSYAAINPSSGTVRTLEVFDEGFVQSVQGMKEIKDADARRTINARIQIGPGKWENLIIFAIEDYDNMRVNRIWPHSGAWPPPEREILVERAAIDLLNAQEGDVILIETPDEKKRHLRIAGLTHDMAQLPAHIDGTPYAYISLDTLEWFGEPYGFNELHVVVQEPDGADANIKDYAQNIVNEVKNKAERGGLTIPMSMTAEPGEVPLDDMLQAVLMLMAVLGVMSLFLSAFLIVNTVSALLTQQKRQIGVMKAVGARTGQTIGMYLVMVIIYGLIALAIAVPLSITGSRELCHFMAAMFNFDLATLQVPRHAVVIQVVVGLLVPVLASLYPFLANLRVTAAEAMSVYRMSRGRFGVGLIDRLIAGSNLWFARRILMRPWLLSLRNTFRSKGRLVLTLITLTLAGATFVSVFSVRDSLLSTLDDMLTLWSNFDAVVSLKRPYRIEKIEREAQRVPGVTQTDTWAQLPARRVRPNGDESGTIYLFAPRADSGLVSSPVIVQGRWLLPEDDNAVVLSTLMLKEEGDIALGDEIVLKIEGREKPYRVVGTCVGLMIPMAYINYPYVAHTTGSVGQTSTVLVKTEHQDPAAVAETLTTLETHFDDIGLRVDSMMTFTKERSEAEANFDIIVVLLFIMSILLTIVGGLGLMGTMSINVLERTREIGILRAIGAPNNGVAQVFIMESVFIGVMSWLAGSALAFPMGKSLSDAVGNIVMGTALSFSFSTTGVWLWLVVVVVLSALASFVPARNASRLTVREVLAYE
ncbi:MAG: ABC transporter permease [Chloroflexi bacterium]|nr:ABC transporter permease [Chloroflexota bacterium]